MRRAFAALAELIVEQGVRLVLSDFLIACYRFVPVLNRQGIEACLLYFHMEWQSVATRDKLLYDSCGIIVVGDLTHMPNTLLSTSHKLMGRMPPVVW